MFGGFLTEVLLRIIMLYTGIYVFNMELQQRKYEISHKMKLSERLKVITTVIIIFLVELIIYYSGIKKKIGLIIGIPCFVILMPYTVINMIKSLLFYPYSFKLSRELRLVFSLASYGSWTICQGMLSIRSSQYINCFINLSEIIKDFIIVLVLNFWYFTIFFYTITISVLILDEGKICYQHLNQNKQDKKLLFNKSIKCIGIKKWYRTICNFKLIRIILYLSIIFPINSMRTVIGKCIQINVERVIIIALRLSLIGSLLITFVINKYEEILSPKGSDVYEFLCSVVLIPIFITQLVEIKTKSIKN